MNIEKMMNEYPRLSQAQLRDLPVDRLNTDLDNPNFPQPNWEKVDYAPCQSSRLNTEMLACLEAIMNNKETMQGFDIGFRAQIENAVMLAEESQNKVPSIPDHHALDMMDFCRAFVADCEQMHESEAFNYEVDHEALFGPFNVWLEADKSSMVIKWPEMAKHLATAKGLLEPQGLMRSEIASGELS